MKIAIFANDGKQSQNVKQRLEKRFAERHFVLDDKEPDVVISIGGDGPLVISLESDNGQSVSYPLLEVCVKYADCPKRVHYLALNESTLKRISSTMATDVYLGGELFERFRGDGLCVSTPTGSTAYNKSLGGAVVHPNLEVFHR